MFYIAYADASGNKITASERMLAPGPTAVEYPADAAGQIVETADGRAIQQTPSKDNRRRSWIWRGYPEDLSGDRYRILWNLLRSLRSRDRKLYGSSAYVYLKDTTTQELRRQYISNGTASSGASTTLTDSAQTWTSSALIGYIVEIISGTGAGQVRTITANTGTQLTVDSAWTVNPGSGSVYSIRGWIHDWLKCRVLDVSRKPRDDGGMLRFDETRLTFVVEDANWNNL